MKVRALRDGFFDGARRRQGAVFDIGDAKPGKWMEPVTAGDQRKPAAKPRKEPETLSEMARKEHEEQEGLVRRKSAD